MENKIDYSKMSFEDLYGYFSGITGKIRTQEWNQFASDAPDYLCKFSDYLKNIKIERVNSKGKTVKTNAFKELTKSIRDNAVYAAWDRERELIKLGKGTYNWSVAEQDLILNSKGIPPIQEKLGIKYEGQHMYSAATYPQYAGNADNIQFLTDKDHRKGAHNGNTRLNQTHGYYDELNGTMYNFTTGGLDNGFPPVTNLTELCDEVKELGLYNSNWEDRFEAMFPGFKNLDPKQKTMLQRLESFRELSGDTGSFADYIIKNSMDNSYNKNAYVSDLSWKSVDLIDFDSLNIDSKFKDLVKASDLDEISSRKIKQLVYQLEVKKVDPKSIDMDSLFKDCNRSSSIFETFRQMQANDVAEFTAREVKNNNGKYMLKGSITILSPKDLGIDSWLAKQKANLVKVMRDNPRLGEIFGKGGTYVFTALDLVDFADVCGDIYLGIKNNNMTEEEAGERLFSWSCATLCSEIGAEGGAAIGAAIGSLVVPPLGTIAGGLIGGLAGGTLGYVFGKWFGENFYGDIYSASFNFWDSLLSDGHHLLEGSSGNDVFNYTHGENGSESIREVFSNPDDTDITFNIEAKGGNDYVAGYQNEDTLIGGSGSDVLIGAGGDDTIFGDEYEHNYKAESDEIGYDDIIYGGSGDDYIRGGAGNDVIYGDGIKSQAEISDKDIFRMPELGSDDKWMEREGLFEVFNPYSDLDETFDDTIYGEDGTDYIYGGQGNDTIHGGNDADVIYGEDGDDDLYGDEGDDYIDGGEGNNTIIGDVGDDFIISGSGNDTIRAMKGNDTVVVEGGSNYIVGGTGNDFIRGGSENDTIYGDRDDGVSDWHDGNDTIYGGAGNDTIHAGGGNNYIDAGNGNDRIYGDLGQNEIHCGSGYDIVYGSVDSDIIYGGDNRDSLHGGFSNDIIYGDNDKDTIYGEDGSDELYGGYGDDTIIGGDGKDLLCGEAENDDLYGGKENDILDGGEGDDYLFGEEGDDSYFFGYGYGADTVFDQYGISHIELGEIEIEDLTYKINESGHDLVLSFESSPEDTLTIKKFDQYRENYYFWIDDESYQIDENGELVQKDPPESPLSATTTNGSFLGNIRNNTISVICKRYDDAGKAQPPRDPLIIDLNNDGVHTTDVENGVYFDIDNNGFAEKTAWIDSIDGFLVYNRDDNPNINNGSELFSDQVIFTDGTRSTDGFDVLQRFDTNGDNVINIEDDEFNSLRVWVDKNHDGITYLPVSVTENELAKKELFTLDELGITSIGTIPQSPDDEAEDALNKELFAHVTIRGEQHTISEHWFEANASDTQELHTEGIDDDLTSFGNLHSISYALQAENDTDGFLNSLYESFILSGDYIEKRLLVKKILYHISGADSIPINSRGGSIDARELHVIETIMGVDHFIGAGNTINPNSNAATILREVYNNFENLYFVLLNDNTTSSTYLDLIKESIDDNSNIYINLDLIKQVLDDYILNNETTDEMMCSIGMLLKAYDNANNTEYFVAFKQEYSVQNAFFAKMADANFMLGTDNSDGINGNSTNEVINGENGNDTINAYGGDDIIYGGGGNDTINAGSGDDIVYGGDGNDEITGGDGKDLLYGEDGDDIINGNAGNDIIDGGIGNDAITGGTNEDVLYGEDGNDSLDGGEDNDVLYGGDGNDSLSGGSGDDILSGGAGDDTYNINADHGNDTIYDSEGLSTLAFGDELSADGYSLHIDINSGISLVNTETEETISIPDFINMPEAYDFTFEGEAQIIGGGSSRQVIEGTDEDDTITAENGFNIIRGENGDDTITGGDNLDFIYGGEGNDIINGGNGTNIIRGEAGDDAITDGVNDGYLDGGDGNDTIHAGAGNDVIIGGAGVDILYGEDGDDVIAGNEDNDEIYGGNGNDTVYADAGNDTVHGDNGNDSLFGGDGNDTLYGDAGDDYLEAGNGEDTLYGGEGNDVFVGGEGINNMYGEDGDDVFHGGNGINNMYGGDGDDNFTGGELADYIEGGAGNDTMNGGNGNNRMFGNDGDDTIYGGNDDDHIDGGEGNDEVFGGNGVNTIYGGAGNDIIHDGDNDSFLYGGDGDDEIRAGGGSDVLDGGAGNDYLQSDHGGDTYVFGIGYDVDTINASADLNTILIHGYTAADMHNTRMQNNDLVIDFGEDTGDRLVITGFFNFTSNRDFNFTFDDETVLGQHDITAKSAPITGTDDNDYLFGTDGNDIFDGGAGDDILNGSNGEDTYIFGKGYAHDTINEWGSDHSFVELKDVASDEVTISDQWGSNLLIAVNDTEDVLTISNFKWGQASYTFRFADGAEGYVDKDTWQLILTKQPDPVEEDIEQTNAEFLNEIYSDDEFGADIFENDSTIISEVTDSITVSDDTDEVSDMTDIQTMILAENMSAFSDDSNVYDNTNITDITADTSALDQLIVSSVQ